MYFSVIQKTTIFKRVLKKINPENLQLISVQNSLIHKDSLSSQNSVHLQYKMYIAWITLSLEEVYRVPF